MLREQMCMISLSQGVYSSLTYRQKISVHWLWEEDMESQLQRVPNEKTLELYGHIMHICLIPQNHVLQHGKMLSFMLCFTMRNNEKEILIETFNTRNIAATLRI